MLRTVQINTVLPRYYGQKFTNGGVQTQREKKKELVKVLQSLRYFLAGAVIQK